MAGDAGRAEQPERFAEHSARKARHGRGRGNRSRPLISACCTKDAPKTHLIRTKGRQIMKTGRLCLLIAALVASPCIVAEAQDPKTSKDITGTILDVTSWQIHCAAPDRRQLRRHERNRGVTGTAAHSEQRDPCTAADPVRRQGRMALGRTHHRRPLQLYGHALFSEPGDGAEAGRQALAPRGGVLRLRRLAARLRLRRPRRVGCTGHGAA